MNLADAIKRVKRRRGYGQLTVTSDQATQDVLDELNDFINDGWIRKNWTYRLNDISISTVSGQQDYSLTALDGDIQELRPQAGGPPLVRLTYTQYLKWNRDRGLSDSEDQGSVYGYVHRGRDSSDRLKVRLVHTPDVTGDIYVGAAKLRLTEYVLADIATNTGIQFFPEEAHNIIVRGAAAGIAAIQGKREESEALRERALEALDELWGKENAAPDKNLRRSLPGMIRRRMRARGGTRVA